MANDSLKPESCSFGLEFGMFRNHWISNSRNPFKEALDSAEHRSPNSYLCDSFG